MWPTDVHEREILTTNKEILKRDETQTQDDDVAVLCTTSSNSSSELLAAYLRKLIVDMNSPSNFELIKKKFRKKTDLFTIIN